MKGILCFGDSITFGRGEMPSIGWVGRLKDYFEVKGSHNGVYNLGVPGHTSTDLLKRFDVEIKGRIRIKRPSDEYLILIAIGTNDCKFDGGPENNKPRTTDDQFKKNIEELIKRANNYQAKLVFIGLPPVDKFRTLPYEETWFEPERVKLFNNLVKELCKENNVLFLDILDVMSKENYPLLLEDGLHPNSKGYQFMYEKIKEFLIKEGLMK
jgi:lysophospholipase L1-like esterase